MVKYLLLLAAFVAGASAQNNLLQLQVLHSTGFGGVCLDCSSIQCYTYLSACPYYAQRLYYQDSCSALNRLPPIVIPRVCTYLNYVREEGAVLRLGGYQCLCQNGEFSQCTAIESNTIAQVIAQEPATPNDQWVSVFSDLIEMDEYSDIYDLLNNASNTLTAFIPTDKALNQFVVDNNLDLVADAVAIKAVLTYHVATTGGYSSRILAGVSELAMANGEVVALSRDVLSNPFLGTLYYGSLKVNNASVTTADIIASNGLVHIIDGVLLPEEIPQANSLYAVIQANPEFLLFSQIISSPGYEVLVSYFSDINVTATVFIPSSAALTQFFAVNNINPLDGQASTQNLVISVFLRHVYGEAALLDINIPFGVTELTTLSTQDIVVTRSPQTNFIVISPGTSTVLVPDFIASNGVAHSVSAVIFAPAVPVPLPSP